MRGKAMATGKELYGMMSCKRCAAAGIAARMFLMAAIAAMAGDGRSETVTYDLSRLYAPYLTTSETKIWENRDLADIESFTCMVKGGWIGTATPGIGVICERAPGAMTVQFQCVNGGCKTVRAYFRQEGADIVARADKAARGDESSYGTPLPDSLFTTSLATSDTANGYGAYGIEAFGDVSRTIGELPAGADEIVVDGGILQVDVAGDCTVSMPISGNGGIRFHGSGARIETQHEFGKYVTKNAQTLIEDTDVFDVEITSAVFNGGWVGRVEGGKVYHATTNVMDGTVTVEIMARNANNVLRGMVVQLSQNGGDVAVKGLITRQAGAGQDESVSIYDWTNPDRQIATSATADGYGLESISFTRRSLPTVTLSGVKSWTGGTTADGCKVKVTGSQLAAGTTARAVDVGTLELAAGGEWNVFPQNTFVAETGSEIRCMAPWTINQTDVLKVLGGAVYNGNRNHYVNNALFADGASWSGQTLQVAYQRDACLQTVGDGEIDIFSGFRLVANNSERKVVLDTQADMVVHGALEENTVYSGATLAKKGSARATFAQGGAITGPLQLEGGTISFGDNAVFGALVVTGNAAVEIGAGKTLSFTASAEKEWAADARLDIAGAFDRSNQVIRVGTDATGLTTAQLRAIRINDMRCMIDENGWLHPYKGGFAISIR